MPTTITQITAHDVRFPTSRHLDGSDAMNQAPDYSAAYALIETDKADGPVGHGMTFTIGRGNEICVTAIQSLAPLVVGRTLEDITADMEGFWRSLAGESQLRWIGPEKGAIHLATAAVVNAVWDLWGKIVGGLFPSRALGSPAFLKPQLRACSPPCGIARCGPKVPCRRRPRG
jgi:L-fuconate dehydratase